MKAEAAVREASRRTGAAAPRSLRVRASVRAVDVVVSLAGLAFFLPTLLLIAPAVRLQDGGPALSRQKRIGRAGRLFDCLKFRSMVADAEALLPELIDPEGGERRKLSHHPRVTPLGRLFRLSSAEQLPIPAEWPWTSGWSAILAKPSIWPLSCALCRRC